MEPTIYLPGRGAMNSRALAVQEAVEQYDERLGFAQHQQNRDWIIYVKMPYWAADEGYPLLENRPIYPVLGFGYTIPEPHEAIDRLEKANTAKRGIAILEEMNEDNARIRAESEKRAKEAVDEAAERIEFEMRKAGLRQERHFFFPDRG